MAQATLVQAASLAPLPAPPIEKASWLTHAPRGEGRSG